MIKNRIKEYRARYELKQEELAKLVGVRRETIGNLGKREIQSFSGLGNGR